jgi:hypothetical protein
MKGFYRWHHILLFEEFMPVSCKYCGKPLGTGKSEASKRAAEKGIDVINFFI